MKKQILVLDLGHVLFLTQGTEPRASHILGKYSIFELISQSTLCLGL